MTARPPRGDAGSPGVSASPERCRDAAYQLAGRMPACPLPASGDCLL